MVGHPPLGEPIKLVYLRLGIVHFGMKDMIPLRCATHPHRTSAEYGSHVISNAKSTLYQSLRSGRRSSPGTAPMSCRRCSPASFGIRSGPVCEPFVPAFRPPNSLWQTRYARHFPNFSWLPQKAILSPNSSLSGRTQKICGLSAWLREQKDGLLSSKENKELVTLEIWSDSQEITLDWPSCHEFRGKSGL